MTVRSRRFGPLLRLAVSLTFLVLVFLSVDRKGIAVGFERLEPSRWGLALGVFLSLQAVSALKWRGFVGVCGGVLGRGRALVAHGWGLAANLCLPSVIGGDVLRVGLALRGAPQRTPLVLGSVADRVFDLLALLGLAGLGLVVMPATAKFTTDATTTVLMAWILLSLGLAAALGVFGWALRRRPLRKQPRVMLQLARGLRRLRQHPWRALGLLLLALVIQGGFVLVNIVVGASLGLELPVHLWFVLWPLAKVAAMLPLSLGGLGVREAAFAGLLSPYGLQELGVVQSLVWQSVLWVGGLLAGLLAWWWGGWVQTVPQKVRP